MAIFKVSGYINFSGQTTLYFVTPENVGPEVVNRIIKDTQPYEGGFVNFGVPEEIKEIPDTAKLNCPKCDACFADPYKVIDLSDPEYMKNHQKYTKFVLVPRQRR